MPDAGAAGFGELVPSLDYPMLVVTAAYDGDRGGCLVGFATQVSICPPRFLVALSDKNHTWRIARHAEHLGVHLLRSDQRDLAARFGSRTGDEVDKLAGCRWREGPHGTPILDDAPAWFVGRVVERRSFGDHVAHVLDPEVASAPDGRLDPLMFSAVADLDPGHEA